MDNIPISQPYFSGIEREYLLDAFDSTWISSRGKYIEKFETNLSEYLGKPSSLVSNGTVALHLLLLSNGIGPGDEVIISNLTYVATMNAVIYCGAIPRFADVEHESWNIDPKSAEILINSKTKAILVTHLYGQPVDIEGFRKLKQKYGILILEDAAEAIGATFMNEPMGSIFDGGVFSFFGNKTISTGEGGLVVSSSPEIDTLVKILRNQGNDLEEKFNHTHLGYNYRMTNLQAAIGLGQFESLNFMMDKRAEIFRKYRDLMQNIEVEVQGGLPSQATHGHWLFGLVIPKSENYSATSNFFKSHKIEVRPFFKLMSEMCYLENSYVDETPIALRASKKGICIPTFIDLKDQQITQIISALKLYISSL